MAETRPTPFVMHGARDAMAGGLEHIEEQVSGIEKAVLDNPGLAFDLAKTLVESVCRAVLGERSIPFSDADDLPRLFKAASRVLPFLPSDASGEPKIRKSLEQTLNGLHTAIQGICELRNQCGFASHGSGTARPMMESVQALMAAEAADTIVGFLHRVHQQDRAAPLTPREPYEDRPAFDEYEDHPAFNESVDETHGPVRIFEVELRPSEVLYHFEPESYRVYLADFDPAAEGSASDAADLEGSRG